MTDIRVGSEVAIENEDGVWTVLERAKGWFSLEDRDGNTKKARAKSLIVVPVEDDEEAAQTMAKTLAEYKPMYVSAVAYSGAKTQNNGDTIAKLLTGVTPELTCRLADAVLDVEPGTHAARYEALNPGQQRMNAGNRIRGFCKDGKEWDEASVAWVVEAAAKLGIKAD